jgi:hypothetical protein
MLRVMAYLASSWSIYDQMALALCRLHGHDGQLPMKDVLKCDRGRQPMASLVGEPMRRYRWSVSTSYAVRNAVLHGGATATEHRLCEGLRIRGPALLVEESCVLELAKTCRERYGATESETRTPWSWKMPIGEVLRRCHEDADELFGICLCLSTRMVGNIEAILEFREPPAAEVSQAARKRTT